MTRAPLLAKLELSELPGATLPPAGRLLAVDGETAVAFGRTLKIEVAGTAAEVSEHGPEVRVGQAVEQGTRLAESTSVESLPLAEAEEQRRRNELAEQNPIALDEPAAAEAPPPSLASAVSAATPAKRAGGQLEPRTVRPRGMATDTPDWTNRRVRVQFSDGWHRGTALERFVVTGGIEWRVRFDDGDVLRVPEKKMLPGNEAAASGESAPAAPAAPVAAAVPDNVAPVAPVAAAAPTVAPAPMPVPPDDKSFAAVVKRECDARASLHSGSRPTDPATLAREAERAKLLRCPLSNDGRGRHAFRKGTFPPCIMSVMGGSGMLAVVKVANPTAYGFVKAGEYYLTPNRSFNPWVPPYAGACGLMDAKFIPDGQRVFHLFAECTSREKKKIDGEERERIMLPVTSWHGEDCAGAWLYLGYYEVDDEVPEQTFNFNSIRHVEGGDHAEWERVKYHFRHPRHKFGTDNETAMLKKLKDGGYYDRIDNEIDVTGAVIDPTLKSDTHGKKGLEHYAKKYGVVKVMNHLAVREWLREENKKMTLVGVKPCDGDRGYDERVYEALVQAQAWSPKVPRVETDPLLLGPLG